MVIISIILLQIFIFGGLAFFLRHLLTRNVTSATTHLQGMIKDNTEKQEEINKKLQEAEKKRQEILKNADREAKRLKAALMKEMEVERDKILEEAHEHSKELIDRANKTCKAIEKEMELNVNKQAIGKAGELICKVLSADICQILHAQWLELLVSDGLSALDRLRVPEEITRAEICTAFALTEEQRKKLLDRLKEKLERDIMINEQVDSKLVAGLIITLGNLVFDGSFLNKVKEIVNESSTE